MEVTQTLPNIRTDLDTDPDVDPSEKRSEPEAFALFQALRAEVNQQRPRSPYSRSHNRSYSAVSALAAPPMTRTRSLPLYESKQRLGSSPSHSPVRPSSPLRPPPAARASPKRSLEEMRPPLLSTPSFMDIESIAEDSELDITPISRRVPTLDPLTYTSFSQVGHSLLRSSSGRRRPVSPLQNISTALGPPPSPSTLIPGLARPPSPPSARFNEAYPGTLPTLALSTTSSMPSTPTSFRSRSPSISSLETIEDAPDAEAEATEAFNILKLKAAADAEDSDEERRNGRNNRGRGSDAAKRKRWSVCGAERRGDFEMETIWED